MYLAGGLKLVSASSRQMDYYRKLLKYGTAGVREYWVVDPEKQCVVAYNFENDSIGEYTFTDKVKAGIYEDLEIDFSEIDI